MVEAYKDWDDIDRNCKSCIGEISGNYKEEVNTRYPQHGQIEKYDFNAWILIFRIMIAKALALVTGHTSNNDFETFSERLSQYEIFKAQKKIVEDIEEIVILTPIPFVLLVELGPSFYNQNIKDNLLIPSCNFNCYRIQEYRALNRIV